jgi:hypothetical protein
MKRIFGFVPSVATAVILTMSPALAKTAHHPARQNDQEPYVYAPAPQTRWNQSDPSYTSPGYNQARRLGRCVEDLGYGRYEYCD